MNNGSFGRKDRSMARVIQGLLIVALLAVAPLTGTACGPKSAPPPPPAPAEAAITRTIPDEQALEIPASQPATDAVIVPTTQERPGTAPATQNTATTTPVTQPVAEEESDFPPVAPVAPNAALADRFAETAQDVLRRDVVTDASWRMARSLLEAARRLDPDQPRYARDLIEALLYLRATDDAIATLADYRQLVPEDQVAQVRQIDLYLGQLETADHRLKYLTRIIDTPSVPAAVRSAAAVRLHNLRHERAETSEAWTALDQALELNPLNLDALRLRIAELPTTQPAEGDAPMDVQRVKLLLAMLSANPVQPEVSEELARELAIAGLVDLALEQYQLSFGMYRAMAILPSQEAAVDFAAEFVMNDDLRSADALATELLNADPSNIEGWFLRMLIARSEGDQARLNTLKQQTAVALANHVQGLLREAGDESATTRPVEVPPAEGAIPADPLAAPADPLAAPPAPIVVGDVLPDPAAALQKIRQADRPELVDAFSVIASDVAWFLVYYAGQGGSDAQPWIDAIKNANPEITERITRLEGWSFLASGQKGEAEVKLSAIADRDPLAELGLIQLQSQGDAPANDALKARASALLNEYPVSLLGATLYQSLKPLGAKVTPSESSKETLAAYEKIPRDLLSIIDRPQQSYALRAEPLKVSHFFGEPVLVRVGVTNVGTVPLTLGPDGVVRPDLWFDAQFRGALKESFSGVAYDRIAGPLVLQPGEETQQIVKVNQGELRALLESNPMKSLQFTTSVMTNPTAAGAEGQISAGPAGQRVTMTRLVERMAMPIQQPAARQSLIGATATGTPTQKIAALELIATLIATLEHEPPPAPDSPAGAADAADPTPQIIRELREALRRATFETDPTVRAYAHYLTGRIAPPQQQAAVIERLAGGSAWQDRLLAGMLILQTQQEIPAIDALAESDPDPAVRHFMAALDDLSAVTTQAATTAPSTQPAQ